MAFALSTMQLTSDNFEAHGKIPTRHSGEGENLSPALAWSDPPEGTKSYAILCHDPDAPLVQNGIYGFVHWVLYNLPASTARLEEGSGGGTSGMNDHGGTGYTGPMPPEGHGQHHYYFLVLALDSELDLLAGLTIGEFLEKAEPHLIGVNRLVGTYRRG
ncbi:MULTISPECIES: YbhB/YbcL family Raf kinase inhibitor-like protein [Halomonadaceae]|uniref:YbhB/YbcL family Raf kinase inhibitor-like protein n=1 Tax=Halomonadaceae TaxID=28256 RepID=UPI001599DB72|nr:MULTISPECIES: YbhB/YbcL family Raf kinase inhibitor-like protein [Halomonas]QJQ93989.1 YbhB/YbcL family Raf kinase inhibitor-like protein [Halomonas sp. PA5]